MLGLVFTKNLGPFFYDRQKVKDIFENQTKTLKNMIKGNDTYKSYEEMITAVFMVDDFETELNLLEEILNKKYQLRY